MNRTAGIRNAMLLAAAFCTFWVPAIAAAERAPPPAAEEVPADEAARLSGTGTFGIILGILFAGVVLYGLYDVLFDDDDNDNEDQPASP